MSSANTSGSGGGGFCPSRTEVHLSHLRSYSGMGTADIECLSGCACEPSVLDGTTASRVSVFKVHAFRVRRVLGMRGWRG